MIVKNSTESLPNFHFSISASPALVVLRFRNVLKEYLLERERAVVTIIIAIQLQAPENAMKQYNQGTWMHGNMKRHIIKRSMMQ